MVHYGQAPAVLHARAATLALAFAAHPDRFKGRRPQPPSLPAVVGINLPKIPPTGSGEKTDLTGSPQSHDREAVQGTGTPENGSASAEALASSLPAVH
jgi:hypothetical protein